MLQVKIKYPFSAYLFGRKSDDFKERFQYTEEGMDVSVGFEYENTYKFPKKKEFFCHTKSIIIDFEIKADTFVPVGEEIKKIYAVAHKAVNRILGVLRTYGFAPFIYEEVDRDSDDEVFFFNCSGEYKIGKGGWEKLFDPNNFGIAAVISGRMPKNIGLKVKTPEILTLAWQDIASAVKYAVYPYPEDEFLVKTGEYLWEGNLRMAVISSMDALGITAFEFYRKTGLEKNELDLIALPDQTVLSGVEIEKVRLIEAMLRRIMREGKGIEPQEKAEVVSGIEQVLLLVARLRHTLCRLDEDEELGKIAAELRAKYKVESVLLKEIGGKRVDMTVTFYPTDETLSNDALKEMSDYAVKAVTSLKGRGFDRGKDFHCRFLRYPGRLLARFVEGKFNLVEQELQDEHSV